MDYLDGELAQLLRSETINELLVVYFCLLMTTMV